MRILVIEDEAVTAMVIEGALRQAQHLVDVARDGASGEELALVNDYDVILLDLMLPDADGREICRDLRRQKVVTPILMLTGLSAVEDKVMGLDAGADDYLIKPFNIEELLARVRSLGRRRSELKSSEVRIRDLVIDMVGRTVTRDGKPLQLSAKRFALLEYFIMNPGRVLTREMIGDHIWDMNFDPRSNVIDTLVRRLRDDIDKDAEFPLIHTVRGVGYKFIEGE